MDTNNQEILELINIASKYVELPIFRKSYNFNFIQREHKGYRIIKNKNEITVEFNKRNQIFAALLHINVDDEENYDYSSVNSFDDLGVMIDCARNAPLNVEYIKKTIVQLALIGYDSFQLYLEDCFDITEEHKFGYMRGSYSKNQLKELDDFGKMFGIEIIPSIQTLAHLNQLFRWNEYNEIKDIDDILLIKNDRTHQLIENMIKTLRECFSSNRINICMDEAHNLGRGKYLDINGYEPSFQLFVEHKYFVVSICEKYNFKPMMWSDMFFRSINNDKYYVDNEELNFDGLKINDASLIYWDYYHGKQCSYRKMIKVHKEISNDVIFAGAIWTWRGFVPYLKYTETRMLPAIRACKQQGIKTVLFTLWGDDGNECLRGNAVGSYIFLAEHCKNNKVRNELICKKCKALTGYTYKEWLKLDRPNFIDIKDAGRFNVNPSKYLLYMDPLLSMYDNLINPSYSEIYTRASQRLHILAKRNTEYSYLFELESKLCKALSFKATLSLEIKNAYDNKSIDEMKKCLYNVQKSIEYVKAFYEYYRLCWKKENKMVGFEVQDVRLGGCISRLKYIKDLLEEYIHKGGIIIEELEIERKEFVTSYLTKNNETLIVGYANMVSTNRLSW